MKLSILLLIALAIVTPVFFTYAKDKPVIIQQKPKLQIVVSMCQGGWVRI